MYNYYVYHIMIKKLFSKLFGKSKRNILVILSCLLVPLLLSVKDGFENAGDAIPEIILGKEEMDKKKSEVDSLEQQKNIIRDSTVQEMNEKAATYAEIQNRIETGPGEEEYTEQVIQNVYGK